MNQAGRSRGLEEGGGSRTQFDVCGCLSVGFFAASWFSYRSFLSCYNVSAKQTKAREDQKSREGRKSVCRRALGSPHVSSPRRSQSSMAPVRLTVSSQKAFVWDMAGTLREPLVPFLLLTTSCQTSRRCESSTTSAASSQEPFLRSASRTSS